MLPSLFFLIKNQANRSIRIIILGKFIMKSDVILP